MFWAITGCVIGGGIALAMLYDWRARNHGWRVYASTQEAANNRPDVHALARDRMLDTGKPDQKAYWHRD